MKGHFKSVTIKRIIPHSQYRIKDASKWSNDIAILKLNRDILPDPLASEIALPPNRFAITSCGAKVKVYGFGKVQARNDTANSTVTANKKVLQVMETVIQNSCWTDSRARFISTQMKNRTVCHGDSGGALVGPSGMLIGVTARSSCVRGKRDLFVKISSHLDFIKKHLPRKKKTKSILQNSKKIIKSL